MPIRDRKGFGFKDHAIDYFVDTVIPRHMAEIEKDPRKGLHAAVDDFLSQTTTLRDKESGRFRTWEEALAI